MKLNAGRCRLQLLFQLLYLQVHLGEADEHPGDEALPEAGGHEAHLDEALQRVVGLLPEAVDVHGWFVGQQVWQQVAAGRQVGDALTASLKPADQFSICS